MKRGALRYALGIIVLLAALVTGNGAWACVDDFDNDLFCDPPEVPVDNCPVTSNPNQFDAAQGGPPDLCGNACDHDYNQDSIILAGDLSMLIGGFAKNGNPVFDCTDIDPGLTTRINVRDFFCLWKRFGEVVCPEPLP